MKKSTATFARSYYTHSKTKSSKPLRQLELSKLHTVTMNRKAVLLTLFITFSLVMSGTAQPISAILTLVSHPSTRVICTLA
jgi:hypothetical protein